MANSLSQEEINFLRLAGLLIRIAPRAVRKKFDDEFHPVQLKQMLSENRREIYDLTYKKRVITQNQYDLLYPRGCSNVSSETFDVSLMVCLLRHFTDLDIHDGLPLAHIHTPEADVSRIKYYRNYIVHSECGKVTDTKFFEIWNCLVEAIRRLSSELKPDIDSLMVSPLTNVRDVKGFLHLKEELEKTNQRLNKIVQKAETIGIENLNFEDIRHRTLQKWRYKDKKYVPTSATTFILHSLKHNRGVIITGSPGCGKSVTAHHVALKLEKEGYDIIPCDEPSEILMYFTKEKIQVFVIDDVCGKFALNQHKSDSWEQYDSKLDMLTESCTLSGDNEENLVKSKIKFIITCRENIYVHKAFPKLTCLSLVQCSFGTKYKISLDEMRNIALSYLPENTVNDIKNICLYDFFPLLCDLYSKKHKHDPRFFSHPVEVIQTEISKMKIKSQTTFLCLSLLVIKNNRCGKDELGCGVLKQLVNNICRETEIEFVGSFVSIQNCFECLKGIYITESDNFYTTIHDKMFDIISAAIAPSIIKCLIEYVDIAFLANRVQLSSYAISSLPFVIYITPELEEIYLQRQCNELSKRNYWQIFGSMQTENKAFRTRLISFLKATYIVSKMIYSPDEDGATPLFVSSYLGYVDFVDYFIETHPYQIGVTDKKGRSSLFVACENGHIAAVEHLLKYSEDVNAENAEKTTALSATCLKGHIEVAELLLDNKADITRTNKLNQNAFHFTCLNGNILLVSLLFGKYNADIIVRANEDQSHLRMGHKKGDTQTVKQVIEVGIHINQKDINGRTPLHLACKQGHYETVKLLLNSNRQTLISRVDTRTKDNYEWSILHSACYKGHIEIVELLIDIGMNVNDRTINGCTPLFLACMKGHLSIVEFLLDLKDETSKSLVDTTINHESGWSVVHSACYHGHIEIVKLLTDAGLSVNDRMNNGCTPLFLACQKGHFEIVKFLLDVKGKSYNSCVDTTINNKDGWSVLHVACSNGHKDVVELLMDVGMNANDTSNNGSTSLYIACQGGHYDIVKYFLDLNCQLFNSGGNTTIKHEGGWSALHVACYYGHKEVVKLLTEVGMIINDTSDKGSTPLCLACRKGHYDTVKFLLNCKGQTSKSRIDSTIKDKNGRSALHSACLNGHTEIIKLLIKAGININDTTNDGTTPLYLACQEGNYEAVKILLQLELKDQTCNSCVDTTIVNKDGWSALHVACCNGHTKVVTLLTDVGIDINDKTNNGCTPLFLACRKGRFDIVKFLLDFKGTTTNNRVDTKINMNNGWSAIHAACYNGHKEVVKLLIDSGMNWNDISNNGSTPLCIARQKGHTDIVEFLLLLNTETLQSRVDLTTEHSHQNLGVHVANSETNNLLIEDGVNVFERTNFRNCCCMIL